VRSAYIKGQDTHTRLLARALGLGRLTLCVTNRGHSYGLLPG
jgi:hypothetical protein